MTRFHCVTRHVLNDRLKKCAHIAHWLCESLRNHKLLNFLITLKEKQCKSRNMLFYTNCQLKKHNPVFFSMSCQYCSLSQHYSNCSKWLLWLAAHPKKNRPHHWRQVPFCLVYFCFVILVKYQEVALMHRMFKKKDIILVFTIAPHIQTDSCWMSDFMNLLLLGQVIT